MKQEVLIAEVYERAAYRDPLEFLIKLESGACTGCIWAREAWDETYCEKGQRFGLKCKLYADEAGVVDR